MNLLHHLALRLSGRAWAVKGGIALRFFHRSPRLSEDMDLDIVRQVRSKTLEEAMDNVLSSRALLASLAPHGITSLGVRKPKQTETTQRWNVQLVLGGHSLPTKVEFSRRSENIAYAKGMPDRELLAAYKMFPFAAQFYDVHAMTAQKLLALAAPARNATRDLFDIHHLLFNSTEKPEDLLGPMDGRTVEKAADKLNKFSYVDFRREVLPYLPDNLMSLYREELAFEELKNRVGQALIQASP